MILRIVCGHPLDMVDETSITSATSASPVCRQFIWEAVSAECDGLGLDHVPNDLFHNVQILILSYNIFQHLANTSFCQYPLIYQLDLSKNDIRFIERETFKPLRHLWLLDLNDNPNLHRLDFEIFQWSNQLESLRVENIGLVYLPDNSMKWLQNVGLSVAKNYLTSVNLKSCSSPNISISLSYNHIADLTPESISISCELQSLGLVGNPVISVDPSFFSSLRTESLDLGGDAMSLDMWRTAFKGIAKSNIRSLSIFPTGINCIPRDFFDPFQNHSPSSLTIYGYHLEMYGNRSLNCIDFSALRNLSKISALSLYCCNITTSRTALL